MFDFGIAGYQPVWLNHCSDLVREHGPRLRGLEGRTLTSVWTVWDLEGDEWFCDCPVVFDFEGEQVEINHNKFDDLSVTWNTIETARPVRWPGFRLHWRPDPLPELHALRGGHSPGSNSSSGRAGTWPKEASVSASSSRSGGPPSSTPSTRTG